MTSRAARTCASVLSLTIVLAASTANAGSAPTPTPGDYSLTVYGPNFNIVYQVEQSAATINPGTLYELSPETSITVGPNSVLLPNVSIFGSGALGIPQCAPHGSFTQRAATRGAGPFDAIFGLVYDPNTQVWNGNNINYFLGFSAGPPGVGTPYGGAAGIYNSEANGGTPFGPQFFNATQYLRTTLQADGYSAYFYDPAALPEPSSMTLMLVAGGAASALGALQRLRKSRAKIA